MHIGVGLSITNTSITVSNRNRAIQNTVKEALFGRRMIRVRRKDAHLVIEPYALGCHEGVEVVRGIIVAIEGPRRAPLRRVDIPLAELRGAELHDLGFAPHEAVDLRGLERVDAVVEPLDLFEDRRESIAG